jgi:predicted RecA/RadA family phage recombinase
MLARYVHEGKVIDYTPVADIAAGVVIVYGSLIGITMRDLKKDQLGELQVSGVFDVAKTADTDTAIPLGAKVYWDEAMAVATANDVGGIYMGKAVADAADSDTTVRVKLDQ